MAILLLILSGASEPNQYLMLTLCPASGCSSSNPECQSYVTPVRECFNGQALFPNDESWGDFDVLDEVYLGDINESHAHILRRSFYETTDGSCEGTPTDEFRLPFNQCVGPFGDPLPWGTFEMLSNDQLSTT